jgi:cbb3-type cytochrome oxidase subunit 3
MITGDGAVLMLLVLLTVGVVVFLFTPSNKEKE